MIFIQKGDTPLTKQQAETRGQQILENEKAGFQREAEQALVPSHYANFAQQWVYDNFVNEANNTFNHQLAAYREAVARLAKYELSKGRKEVRGTLETGEFDEETGEPITEETVTVPAIEPLEATITVSTYDEETGEPTGEEEVPNPVIVQDEAERAGSQALIDALPDEVKEFDA